MSAHANIPRSDLAGAGVGDGSHGFNIDLTEAQISPDAVSTIEVLAVSGDNTVRLTRTAAQSTRIVDLLSDAQIPIFDELHYPVFILGPARSGTSAIALGLLASTRYEGSGEGHLLPLAHAVLSTADNYYEKHRGIQSDTMLGRVPAAAFQKLVRRSFIQLARDLFPTGYWLDKTPTVEMVRAAPLMKELWPNARFIFMKRRVIENVLSRSRKFTTDTIDKHYSDWIAVMSAWLVVRERLSEVALEIDHHELVFNPIGVGSRIATFLNMPDAASSRLIQYISKSRPEQTDDNFGAVYTFADLGLGDKQATQMRVACDPLMVAYGYDYGDAYYLGPDIASDINPVGSKGPHRTQ
jgi:hypothetical protein